MPLQGVQVTPGVGPPILTRLLPDGTQVQLVQVHLSAESGQDVTLQPGQKPAAQSIPVVLASDSPPINVSAPAGSATEATLLTVAKETTLQAVGAVLSTLGTQATLQAVLTALGPLATQATVATLATQATLATRNAEATQALVQAGIGAVADAPPATDTTASSLIGQLKRLLQRFTSLLAVFPATLSTNVGAADASTLRVAFASGSVVTTSGAGPANSTAVAVASSASNVTLLAANANRRGAAIYNNSTSIMYVRLGANTATAWTVIIPASGYYEVPFGYTGIIDGVWQTAGSGNCYVTELLP
jgi:hypothetical protein